MAVCTKTSQKQSEPTVKNLTMTLRNKLQNFINLMSQNILPDFRKFCRFVKKTLPELYSVIGKFSFLLVYSFQATRFTLMKDKKTCYRLLPPPIRKTVN